METPKTNHNFNTHHPPQKLYQQRCAPRCDALNEPPWTQPIPGPRTTKQIDTHKCGPGTAPKEARIRHRVFECIVGGGWWVIRKHPKSPKPTRTPKAPGPHPLNGGRSRLSAKATMAQTPLLMEGATLCGILPGWSALVWLGPVVWPKTRRGRQVRGDIIVYINLCAPHTPATKVLGFGGG